MYILSPPGGVAGEESRRRLLTGSPYRGLSAFGPEDCELFFGRDEAVERVLERVAECLDGPVDRANGIEDLRAAFCWVPVHDRAHARAWEVQGDLTVKGQHRGAGPVDLIVAATAELSGLTLLHHDRDFDAIAAITGQPVRWYGTG
jgi:predicted nucleic acid-binding protein